MKAAGVIFWICFFTSQTLFASEDKQPIVFIKKASIAELADILNYPARIEPKIKAAVTSEASGVVTRIIAPLGTKVRRSQPLMVIKNTDPGYAPLIVRAPVTGIVSQVEVSEGSRVNSGEKLLLVTDPNQVRVTVEIAAQDIHSIKPGLLGSLFLDSDLSPLKLRVKGVSPFVDPGTGTASCELELVSPQKVPAPGLIGRVEFKVNPRRGYTIPDSALTYKGKNPFLRIVEAGKAKFVPIALGRRQGGLIEILKGLKEGDQVVERASGYVADGEAVKVQTPTEG